MAYDDIISKLCFTLEQNTLTKKITSNNITEKFVSTEGFGEKIYSEVKNVIIYFLRKFIYVKAEIPIKLNLNKATLYSWLLFTYRNKLMLNHNELGTLIYKFENVRQEFKGKTLSHSLQLENKIIQSIIRHFQSMILLFNQKASMGSTDVTSIIFRDIILEISKEIILEKDNKLSNMLATDYRITQNLQAEYLIFNKRFELGGQLN